MRKKFTGNTGSLSDLATVEGVYEGAKEVQRPDGGTSLIHTFRPKTGGDPTDIWGFGQIDFALKTLQGKYVWLTYTGMKDRQTRFGLHEVHTADVEFDDVESPAKPARSRKP